MNRTTILIALLVLAFPSMAFAHATPVEVSPASGAQLALSPSEVSIRFSERLEEGSSRIRVENTSGALVTEGNAHVDSENPYFLSVPLSVLKEEVYVVSWGVVSEDDGHFTKGSFAFSVGSSTAPTSATDSVVIQVTSYPEATAMFVEFVGNSMLWGIVLMFALILRSLLKEDRFGGHRERIEKIYTRLAFLGVLTGLLGAGMQILWKAHELSLLHAVGFSEALGMYVHTMAGSSTLYRMGAFLAFGIFFIFFRKRIFSSTKFTIGESLLLVALFVFAYFRSIVSHATANLFYPEISVGVNIVHLIEKDLWLGILIVPIILFFSSARYILLPAVIPRVFAFLSMNFVLLSCTASYIIWLHLKDFGNIPTTLWGEHFLKLGAATLVLIGLRAYHVYAIRFKPRLFARILAYSISVEAAAAALTIFFSSLVIITSPPLQAPSTSVFMARDSGVSIRLERSPIEDAQALLSIQGKTKQPLVMIGEGEGGLQPALSKRFEGEYTFPLALITGKDVQLSVTVPQQDGYDAHARFSIAADAFSTASGHGRTFDTFTFTMMGIAFLGSALAVGMYLLLRRTTLSEDIPASSLTTKFLIGVTLGICAVLMSSAGLQLLFGNHFKKVCESDGNMWHLMTPMKAGIPVSSTPREGCMWGMGKYTYLFADSREYEFNKTLGAAEVTLSTAPQRLAAGVPATFTVLLKNADGSPATLFVDMEKLVHLVIVSKDQSVFAHIHADDVRPLTQQEIDSSTFTLQYTFPKAGEYLLSVDYAHGISLESKQFTVVVEGNPPQSPQVQEYPSTGMFGGYTVALSYVLPVANEVTTLKYAIKKDGQTVQNLVPYLSAAMHIAAVKNDFSSFLHTHGEIHPPGTPYPPILIKNGKVVHSMAFMITPPVFAGFVEAHVIFPTAGLYTVWGQFKVGDKVIPTAFTVRVES